MTYESGDLHLTAPGDGVSDSRQDRYPEVEGAYLDHSCDEWVIGGPEEIRAMIVDLKVALKTLEGRDRNGDGI